MKKPFNDVCCNAISVINFAPLQAAASDDMHLDNFPNKPDTPFS